MLGSGLALWVNALSMTKPKSMQWHGAHCSSFTVLSVAQSQRCAANRWAGDTSRSCVRDGNAQMVVASLLLWLSIMVGNVPILEQPRDSVMVKCRPLNIVLSWTCATCARTYMQTLGGPTLKPLQLWPTSSMIKDLERPMPLVPEGAWPHAQQMGVLTLGRRT